MPSACKQEPNLFDIQQSVIQFYRIFFKDKEVQPLLQFILILWVFDEKL
jgi:hypothetical protein